MNEAEGVEFFQDFKHLDANRYDCLEREISVSLAVEGLKVNIKLCHDHKPEVLLFVIPVGQESRQAYLV